MHDYFKRFYQRHPKLSKLLIVVGVLYVSWYLWTQPHFWKELDPTKPGFDVTKFRFEDYPDEEDLTRVIGVIVPIGSTKQHIDKTIGLDAEVKHFMIKCKKGNVLEDTEISYYYPFVNRLISPGIWWYVEKRVVSFRFEEGGVFNGSVRFKTKFSPLYEKNISDFCKTRL